MTQTKSYALRIKKNARKALAGLQPKFFKQVMTKIMLLMEQPRPQDYAPLQGYPGYYRADQGEYRIIYTIGESEVEVLRVGKRNDDEVYRNL